MPMTTTRWRCGCTRASDSNRSAPSPPSCTDSSPTPPRRAETAPCSGWCRRGGVVSARGRAARAGARGPGRAGRGARAQGRRRLRSAASAVAGLRFGQVAQELLHLATVLLRRTAQALVPSRDEPAQGRVGWGSEILIAFDGDGGLHAGGDETGDLPRELAAGLAHAHLLADAHLLGGLDPLPVDLDVSAAAGLS